MHQSDPTLTEYSRNTVATPIKVVVVGDGAVGKTSLLCRYANGWFPTEDYLPTIFDNFTAHTIYNNEYYSVSLWDTAGIEQYDRLRPLSYLGADIFLLCFDLVQPSSLYNSVDRWITDLNRHASGVPVMLCGNKLDLRINKKYITAAMKKNSWMGPVCFDQAVEVREREEMFDHENRILVFIILTLLFQFSFRSPRRLELWRMPSHQRSWDKVSKNCSRK